MNTPTTTRDVAIRRTLALLALTLCAAAQAQPVRKCQVDGRAVFQSSPCHVEARVVASAVTPAVTANTPADTSAAPKKKTLADLLRERDGADRGRPPSREFQNDGAAVLRSRMGAV